MVSRFIFDDPLTLPEERAEQGNVRFLIELGNGRRVIPVPLIPIHRALERLSEIKSNKPIGFLNSS